MMLRKLLNYLTLMTLFIICMPSFSTTIPIIGKVIVDRPLVYRNVTLDMSRGSFVIRNRGRLTIQNCVINGVMSKEKKYLMLLENGVLVLQNNDVNITVLEIDPAPLKTALYYAITIHDGRINITGNHFSIDKSYTVGLIGALRERTNGFIISNNDIANAHGGIFLRNSHRATITNNRFTKVSNGNVFLLESTQSEIANNALLFPGNNYLGDGFDIEDSRGILVKNNIVLSGSCYGMVLMRNRNVVIDNNVFANGITYAIMATPSLGYDHRPLIKVNKGLSKQVTAFNNNIVITNNAFIQNRYGIAADSINGLTVENNIFSQRFVNAKERKFWTNNDILLQDVRRLIWTNNIYKEAFTQEMDGDNTIALKYVPFPVSGGVVM